MRISEYILFISSFIVFYNYIGYAIIVYLINTFKRYGNKQSGAIDFFPTVSFIVAAYNEEDCVEKKIADCLNQDYPEKNIEYIFITDGSTDRTAEIVEAHAEIKLMHNDERKGKSAAVNRAVEAAKNDILIFSDANTFLSKDAVLNIASHYADEKVGGVAGEKKVIAENAYGHEVGDGEGFYWKYESFLKKIDSEFYSVVGAAGELFSLRRNLYEPVDNTVILDDFIISLKAAQKGFRIIYEPDACAMELPSFSLKDEKKRKIRIAAGGFQSIVMLGSLFYFWKYPRLSFLYFSHRFLRWALSPFCLVFAFFSNLILFFISSNHFFEAFFILQFCFYFIAFAATFISSTKKIYRLFKFPYYFVFMNISVLQGFVRFLFGKQSAAWEKSKRSQSSI